MVYIIVLEDLFLKRHKFNTEVCGHCAEDLSSPKWATVLLPWNRCSILLCWFEPWLADGLLSVTYLLKPPVSSKRVPKHRYGNKKVTWMPWLTETLPASLEGTPLLTLNWFQVQRTFFFFFLVCVCSNCLVIVWARVSVFVSLWLGNTQSNTALQRYTASLFGKLIIHHLPHKAIVGGASSCVSLCSHCWFVSCLWRRRTWKLLGLNVSMLDRQELQVCFKTWGWLWNIAKSNHHRRY